MPDWQSKGAGLVLVMVLLVVADGQEINIPEERPPALPSRTCGPAEATCANGDCVLKSLVCDGNFDCADGSDERNCRGGDGCEPNEFQCDNKRCVLKTWRCDSDDDCGDQSDESFCATNPPGSPCKYHEWMCQTGDQCIPKSFHCDGEMDCQDQSDEIGCTPPIILESPPAQVIVDPSFTFVINCTAMGIPTPEIVWRLNWGHVPDKCSMTSTPEDGNRAFGELTCPNAMDMDQGAYSCEVINSKGSCFAGSPGCGQPGQDAIVVLRRPDGICSPGQFNTNAMSEKECLPCFCFGITEECSSAELFLTETRIPNNGYILVGVSVDSSGMASIEPNFQGGELLKSTRAGQIAFSQDTRSFGSNTPFFKLPINGNQLKSYGAYLSLNLRYSGFGDPTQAPTLVLIGNDLTLMYIVPSNELKANEANALKIRLWEGLWFKRAYPNGQGVQGGVPATRNEIMMALQNVQHLLIKGQYLSDVVDTTIESLKIGSAENQDQGLGPATLVEQCRCPKGYMGLSCEECAPDYERVQQGPWKGACRQPVASCPPGYYGDPSGGMECQVCPCPLQSPSNQFGRECYLDNDREVTCRCPMGYEGRRCDQCAPGYNGNPTIPGDFCKPGPSQSCNYPGGSYLPTPDPNTGRCQCQPGYFGNFCERYEPPGQTPPPSQPSTNVCQKDEFRSLEENSCINCFCMGIPQTNGEPTQCQGSNLYRDKERAVFSDDDSLGFVLSTEFPDEPPIDDVFLDLDSNELIHQPTTREKLFWKLPAQFIGNKLVAYGGILQFFLGNTPEISQESILEAPLVEIQGNDIRLLHYTNTPVGPNDPFVVKFIENQWQRQDGQRTGREHLLMALANLDHVLIRATFGEGLEDIRIGNVTMDVAGGRDSGFPRASSVEQCSCPLGYKGLSCEKCSPGYTRSSEGLYLGLCQPCQCYGYANTCDPDNGVCIGCRDGTTGAYCDRCEQGYEGDPTRGVPCTRSSEGGLTCSCDPRGSLSQECDNYQCDCKANVEGSNCNRCRSGTFDLDASNPIGCSECWCAGVTNECFESPLYWSTLRVLPTDNEHGVTLKDMARREDFSRDIQYENGEVHYKYASESDKPLYWSLPAQFIGNKIESYGGNLTINQRYGGSGDVLDLADVIMVGNGVALHWKNPDLSSWTPNERMETVLSLRERGWIRVQGGVPSEATKDDFLTALSNLDVILIRATILEYTSQTSLRKVMMDVAVQQDTGFPSTGIEECQCPVGYQGNSCQECAVGYYRDPSDRSEGSLGRCTPCRCSGNEQECSLDSEGVLQCTCQPGYSGPRCESVDREARPPYQPNTPRPTRPPYQPYPPQVTVPPYQPPQNTPPIEVTITSPKIQIMEVGQTVQFQCNANNRFQNSPVAISWSKADGSLPFGRYNDNQRGLLVIMGIQVSDQGTYVCTATDGVYTIAEETVLTVDGNNGPPPGKPTVRTEPRYIYSTEGESAQFICIAEGNPPPTIRWRPGRGNLNNAEVRDQTLSFNRVRKEDEGDYFCVASNDYGESEERIFLYVEEREYNPPSITTLPPPPQPQPRPPYGTPPIQISPESYTGNPGESIRLDCRASQPGYSIYWSKQSGRLPYSASQENGVLIIPNPSISDSGVYICMASNPSGVRQESQAVISIQSYPSEPVPYNPNAPEQELRIVPQQQTVPQGTEATLRCNGASGSSNVAWTKIPDEDLSQNPSVQISGNTLTIRNLQVSDRGVYVCTVTGPNGMDRSSAILEVERRERPQIEIYPQPAQRIITSQSVMFQCRVMAGIPMPTLTWTRSDGRQMPPNVEVLEGGVLRIMNVMGPEKGEYRCLAENLAGREERIATLVVQERPEVTLNPNNSIQINTGDQRSITCTAKGNPLPKITWEKINEGPIQVPTSPTSSDTVSSTYTIPRAARENQGSYLCKAVSEAGEDQGMVQVIVLEPGVPGAPYPAQPDYGRPEYERPEYGRPDGRPDYGRPEDRPDYNRPEERPDYGRQDERPNYNRPEERPNYNRPDERPEYGRPNYGQTGGVEVSQEQFEGPLGGDAELRCFVTGNMPDIKQQWLRANNQRLPSGSYERGGTLYLKDLKREDGGQYTCQGVDSSNRVLFRATTNLLVTAPPRIILDPAKQVVNLGEDARIACVATGDQPIEIEWTKQNGRLPQSVMVQGGIMEFRGISPSDQGKYVCLASNDAGRAEAVAEVIVQDNLVRITWLEAVLYSPEGKVVNDPLYTFNFDDESERESGSGSKSDNAEGSGEMDDWDHGNRGGGVGQGSPEYDDQEPERDYPPVEPYESKERYIGVKATEDNEYSYEVGDQFTAREGSSIDLRCRLDTSNGRYLTWNKENGYIPRQAIEMQDGVLRIPNVLPSDSGRYICSNNQDRQYVFLTIDSYQGGDGTGGNNGGGAGGSGGDGDNTNDEGSITDPRFGDFPGYPGYPGDGGSSGPYAEPSRGDSGDPYGDDGAYASYPSYGSPSTDPQALTRPKVKCNENEFRCLKREECINIAFVCDGEIDCTDGSDETSCRNRRSAFTQAEVEIQSNRNKVFEGDDLELRCSLVGDSTGAEGRVSWTKLNSFLSSNVQDMGSVLRFTKLQEDDTGTYQCTIYTSQGNMFQQNFELDVEGWNFF